MFRQFRQFRKGELVVVGVDTAMGAGDYVAAQFMSKHQLDVPLVFHSPKTMADFTPQLALILDKIYDITGIRPVVAIERGNGGSFELDRLAAMNRNGKFEIFHMPVAGNVDPGESVKLGWDTNSASRPKMLQDLKDAVDQRLLRIYDKPTVDEMFSFVNVQTTTTWKAQADKNAHDDLVMSLAIAWQLHLAVEFPSLPVNREELPKYQPHDSIIGI